MVETASKSKKHSCAHTPDIHLLHKIFSHDQPQFRTSKQNLNSHKKSYQILFPY